MEKKQELSGQETSPKKNLVPSTGHKKLSRREQELKKMREAWKLRDLEKEKQTNVAFKDISVNSGSLNFPITHSGKFPVTPRKRSANPRSFELLETIKEEDEQELPEVPSIKPNTNLSTQTSTSTEIPKEEFKTDTDQT